MVLSELEKEKGDMYIYNNLRICDHHFENAVPTLNIGEYLLYGTIKLNPFFSLSVGQVAPPIVH